jgi:DNA-binding MarR family transcriptional regulator
MLAKPSHSQASAGSDTEPHPHLRVLRQFRLVFSAVRRHFSQMEKVAGLGGAPIWAMSLIAQAPGMRVSQLAHAMDVHQSTASNLVRALIQAGYVHSEKSTSDRRVAELYPLPAGHKLLRKVPGPYTGVLPQALSELDTSTLLELENHLAVLLQKLDIDERSAKTPMALM